MLGVCTYFDERYYAYAHKDLAFAGYNFDKCPSCGRNIAHELPPTGKTGYILDGGKRCPDFLHYGGGRLKFLVSEKVIQVFSENGVIGYDQVTEIPTYRICKSSLEKQDVKYFEVNIHGSIDFNLKAMALKRKHLCPICNQFDWSRQRLGIIRTVFDMDTWDHSDLCRIHSFPGHVVCSEKIEKIVKEYSLRGIRFKPEDRILS